MKIAIMGTGGVGGYYGGLLAKQANDVTFIARGEQLEAILNQWDACEEHPWQFPRQPCRGYG